MSWTWWFFWCDHGMPKTSVLITDHLGLEHVLHSFHSLRDLRVYQWTQILTKKVDENIVILFSLAWAKISISEQWDDCENVSATQCFLKYLEYPADENTSIDIKHALVVTMSHLDRLAAPHQPMGMGHLVMSQAQFNMYEALYPPQFVSGRHCFP